MRSSFKGYCFFVRQLLFFFLYSFFLFPEKGVPYSIPQEVLLSSAFRKAQQPGSLRKQWCKRTEQIATGK
jgi:hypothetical protein